MPLGPAATVARCAVRVVRKSADCRTAVLEPALPTVPSADAPWLRWKPLLESCYTLESVWRKFALPGHVAVVVGDPLPPHRTRGVVSRQQASSLAQT